jgi:hypothetical protein
MPEAGLRRPDPAGRLESETGHRSALRFLHLLYSTLSIITSKKCRLRITLNKVFYERHRRKVFADTHDGTQQDTEHIGTFGPSRLSAPRAMESHLLLRSRMSGPDRAHHVRLLWKRICIAPLPPSSLPTTGHNPRLQTLPRRSSTHVLHHEHIRCGRA